MLSRVAQRMYWAARYLERAEDTARLVNVHGQVLLDLPNEADIGWQQVVEVFGQAARRPARRSRSTDADVLKLLLTDTANPSSLISSLDAARESLLGTRDIIPTEAWRCVNEMCLYARANLRWAVGQRRRHEILTTLVGRAQQLAGLLAGTMSHGPAWQLMIVGTNLERADMTTRIIDVAVATLMQEPGRLRSFHATLWMSTLQSVSGYQMYRQYVRRRIEPANVLAFLLQDGEFPRAVTHCLAQVDAALRLLPNIADPAQRLARARDMVAGLDVAALDNAGLHATVEAIQVETAQMHERMTEAWFTPRAAP